ASASRAHRAPRSRPRRHGRRRDAHRRRPRGCGLLLRVRRAPRARARRAGGGPRGDLRRPGAGAAGAARRGVAGAELHRPRGAVAHRARGARHGVLGPRCARVAAALDMRIATGETDYGSAGMKRHLEARAADVLMPDLQRMGGPTEFLRAAALCHAWQQPVSSHLFTETSAHLLAATPNALILEHMGWWEPLFTEPVAIE